MTDETARDSLTCFINLELADAYAGGWKTMVMAELDRMRAIMPYADTLRVSLISERHPEG